VRGAAAINDPCLWTAPSPKRRAGPGRSRRGSLDRRHSGPRVRVIAQAAAFGERHAEAVARRRLHDAPGVHLFHAACAERLEPPDLCFDVVRLDVQMDTARMIDALNADPRLAGSILQTDVVAGGGSDRAAQGASPEETRRIQVGVLTIDVQRAEAASVHVSIVTARCAVWGANPRAARHAAATAAVNPYLVVDLDAVLDPDWHGDDHYVGVYVPGLLTPADPLDERVASRLHELRALINALKPTHPHLVALVDGLDRMVDLMASLAEPSGIASNCSLTTSSSGFPQVMAYPLYASTSICRGTITTTVR
jgi:hypothetical protein